MGKTEIKTSNYYDGISQGYKNLYHEEQIKKINLIKKFLPEKGIILDLGSGDGVLNQFINEKQVQIISLDLSFKLLKLNQNKNNNKIQASIINLPIKKNSINFLFSFSVFQDLPNVKKAIIETKRIMKKEGIGIISFLKVSSKYNELCQLIKKNFDIIEINEKDIKDIIFVFKVK